MMILSRFCLLILCCGICYAVDSSDVQGVEASDDTMIFDLIYSCFADRGEEQTPCVRFQQQIDCLAPHSEDKFVKELLEGLYSTVSIYGCPLQESAPIDNAVDTSEEETDEEQNEIEDSEDALHHRERRMFKHPCEEYKHPHLDNACANWMYNNYHLLNPGWSACKAVVGKMTRPCGWYWAKCKRAHRNHHCCMSVHCHGKL